MATFVGKLETSVLLETEVTIEADTREQAERAFALVGGADVPFDGGSSRFELEGAEVTVDTVVADSDTEVEDELEGEEDDE